MSDTWGIYLAIAKTQHSEECSMRQQREQYTWSTVPCWSS